MTLTPKNSPDLNSLGKPGASSQNSENKSGESPRTNPVCLEVSVTIRSLPNEAGGQTQPIREEGRTVIVFDNGAVLRSTNNLPIGQTVILSNPNGRDVVCRVVGGRNLPNVKGYVEVEFIEPVNDFWAIHQAGTPAGATASPATPLSPPEAPALPVASSRAAAPVDSPARFSSAPSGRAPTFDDIAGVVSMPAPPAARVAKTESAKSSSAPVARDVSNYNLSEIAQPTSLANWDSTPSDLAVEKRAHSIAGEAMSPVSSSSAPPRDFMSKGLMAYEQPSSSSSSSSGRMPLIVGAAVLVLAGVGGGMFLMNRRSALVADAKAVVMSRPSTPEPPPAAVPAPEPIQAPPDAAAQATTQQAQTQPLPVAVEQPQPVAAIAPVPAFVTGPGSTDSPAESRNPRRQEKKAVVAKQSDTSASRRPAIPNLKMSSPSVPNRNLANTNNGSSAAAEIPSAEIAVGSTPAGLLTSAGRTSSPPAPPSAPAPSVSAPATAPKKVIGPKLISSGRLSYPPSARQSNIQGTVTVAAAIDENGKVVSAKALTGPLLLREAAVDSVKQWKYSPGLVDGKPAPSQVTVGVDFKLN